MQGAATSAAMPRATCCLAVLAAFAMCMIISVLAPGLLRLAAGAKHGCSMLRAGMHIASPPSANAFVLEMWCVFLHWVGLRNLFELARLTVPAYRNTLVAAPPAAAGQHARFALTIDDGIGSNQSAFEELLDVLSRTGTPTTFFITAHWWTLKNSSHESLRRVFDDGHEIGNHGISSWETMDWMSADEFEHALDAWERPIMEILPRWPANDGDRKWFRPPKAAMSVVMADVLEQRGYSVAMGDVWSLDSHIKDAQFHRRIINTATCDGSIVLMHCPSWSDFYQTLGVVDATMPALQQQRGLVPVRLSTLFASAGDEALCAGPSILCIVLVWLGLAILLVRLLILLVRFVISLVLTCVRPGEHGRACMLESS